MYRRARHRVRRLARGAAHVVRRRRRARWGNLRRPYPFSERYGFDRGTPVDRRYLDAFFAAHADDITGHVLEVKDPTYCDRFGVAVERVDIVDIDPNNRRATLIADLAESGSLPSSTYDCVVIPQTLQYVDDPLSAVANVWQSLRPGGVALFTAPSLSRRDPHLPDDDRWRFLPAGLETLLRRACGGGEVSVEAHGGLTSSIAFLLGLAAEELRDRDVQRVDENWPVLSCARVRKPEEPS